MDRGAWQASTVHGVTKSLMWLSQFHLYLAISRCCKLSSIAVLSTWEGCLNADVITCVDKALSLALKPN